MPSSTSKQAAFMRAVAHGWKPNGKKVPPISVAKEFMRADMRAADAEKPARGTIAAGRKS